MEDIKIIKQEVHGEEDIKKHTLALIWKQSVGRIAAMGLIWQCSLAENAGGRTLN